MKIKGLETHSAGAARKILSYEWFRRVPFIILFISCIVYSTQAYPQTNTNLLYKETAESDLKEKEFQKWVITPIVGSSTETGFFSGALAIRFLEPDSPDVKTETIDMIVFGSIKGQFYVTFSPNLYFSGEKYHLNAYINGAFWSGNYYGIGNDTSSEDPIEYESTSFTAECLFERQINRVSYIGGTYTFRHEELGSDDGMIGQRSDIPGSQGGNQAGPGIAVSIDTRDNINDARTGTCILLKSKWFRNIFGSDYDYTTYEFYTNRYIALTRNIGLAFGGQARLARGNIPFLGLNSPNGINILRGIENGRYRDRDMVAFQAEYRFPIKDRWGGTLFVETAQVAHELSEISLDSWKYSLGVGVRYALNPSERFNFRVDLSWVDGGLGVVLNIREAF